MALHPRALVSEFVSILDFFNDAVYLNLNGKRNLTTIIGAALSVGLVAILMYQGISQAVEMYKREGPTIYQISEYESDAAAVPLSPANNFFFAFTTNLDSVVINMSEASLYSFSATFNHYSRHADGSRTKQKYPIYMAPCNKSDFPDAVYGKNAYTLNGLSSAFCPTGINMTNIDGSCSQSILKEYSDCIVPPSFNLQGGYLSRQFDFIQFNLSICNPSDPHLPYGIKCASGNITQTILDSSSEMDLYYSNSMVNPVFYETPNKTLVDNTYWTLNPQIYEISDISLDKVLLQDYNGYLSTTDYVNKTYFSVQTDKLREMQVLRFDTSLPLLTWNLRRSTLTQVTTRTYYKVQDIMTNLGGFSSNLIFVAALVALGYVRYKYQMILSSELYDFQTIEKPNKSNKGGPKATTAGVLSKRSGIELTNQMKDSVKDSAKGDENSSDYEQAPDPNNKVVKSYFDSHLKKNKKVSQNDLKYFAKFFSMLCCRKKPKNQLAQTARNLVLEDLDIIKVITKVKEVDKLKLLLLNRYQREAFNFIEKPLIAVEGEKTVYRNSVMVAESRERNDGKLVKGHKTLDDFLKSREEHDPYMRYARLYMTYRALKEDNNPANLKYNRKLIDLIDPDLVQVFKIVDGKIGEHPTAKKFEEIVKKMIENSEVTFPSDQKI